MRRKIAGLLAFVLLMTALSGCGGSTNEITSPETTETVAETTVEITEETTAPTEPKTFFEEMGFIPWEGLNPQEFTEENKNGNYVDTWLPNSHNVYAKFEITTNGKTELHEFCGLTDTDMYAAYVEYPLKDFTLEELTEILGQEVDIVNCFYEEDVALHGEQTKEEWFGKYQGYKIIQGTAEELVRTGAAVDREYKRLTNSMESRWKASWNFRSGSADAFFMDCINGMTFTITYFNAEIGETAIIQQAFPGYTQEEQDIFFVAKCRFNTVSSSGKNDDLTFDCNYYMMVPSDFDAAFVFGMAAKALTCEEYMENRDEDAEANDSDWEMKPYSEQVDDKTKYYYLK